MSQPDKYTCEDAFNKLDDYLDRELSSEELELVQGHIKTCAQCAGAYKFEGEMLQCVRNKVEHISLPTDLKDRISKALDDIEGG